MIGVLGAGAFGTALAISLAQNENVQLWGRGSEHMAQLKATRENARYLPGMRFPETLSLSNDIREVAKQDILLLAIPIQKLRGLLSDAKALLHDRTLVACCKGMERGTALGPLSVIADCLPEAKSALLTGPSFAQDIAKGLPTALTLASADVARAEVLQQTLTAPALRLYRTTDVVGAELGGALKNVIAIACGAVIGAGLGDSARAALMTRGYAEMQRLALLRGAQPETLAGLSGLGDLVLTCTSTQSRNYRLGLSLGRDADFDADITVEGAETARAIRDNADKEGLDLPITAAVVDLLDKRVTLNDVMARLLSRPLKEE